MAHVLGRGSGVLLLLAGVVSILYSCVLLLFLFAFLLSSQLSLPLLSPFCLIFPCFYPVVLILRFFQSEYLCFLQSLVHACFLFRFLVRFYNMLWVSILSTTVVHIITRWIFKRFTWV